MSQSRKKKRNATGKRIEMPQRGEKKCCRKESRNATLKKYHRQKKNTTEKKCYRDSEKKKHIRYSAMGRNKKYYHIRQLLKHMKDEKKKFFQYGIFR